MDRHYGIGPTLSPAQWLIRGAFILCSGPQDTLWSRAIYQAKLWESWHG